MDIMLVKFLKIKNYVTTKRPKIIIYEFPIKGKGLVKYENQLFNIIFQLKKFL